MERLPPIARARLQRQIAADHPDADLLTAFAEQSLPPPERQQVLEHLSRCAQCREVAALAGGEPEDALHQHEKEQEEYVLVPAAAAASQRREPPAPQRNLWLGHPPARWVAVAACVLVCATVLVRYPSLWRGQHPAAAVGAIPPDQLAKNRETDRERIASGVVPPAAAPSAANHTNSPSAPIAAPRADDLTRVPKSAARALTESDRRAQLAKQMAAAQQSDHVDDMMEPQSQLQTASPTPPPAPASAAPKSSAPARRPATGGGSGSDLAFRSAQQAARAGVVGGVAGAAAGSVAVVRVQPQWTLTGDGVPQRSDDSGHTWQKFPVDASVQFRALYADQKEVWVGGPAGVLYHSSDSGEHWTRVRPTDRENTLSADIARIDFRDALDGDITTAQGRIWSTSDGGVNWIRH